MSAFEQTIRKLTKEINGQYPRPWMTDMEDPSKTEIFVERELDNGTEVFVIPSLALPGFQNWVLTT